MSRYYINDHDPHNPKDFVLRVLLDRVVKGLKANGEKPVRPVNPKTGKAPEGRWGLGDVSTDGSVWRISTEANQERGKWLRDTIDRLGGKKAKHARGQHYRFVTSKIDIAMPDGTVYGDSSVMIKDKNGNDKPFDFWGWIQDTIKAARWLGYIPFDWYEDRKHAEAIDNDEYEEPDPWVGKPVEYELEVPTAEDLAPAPTLYDFRGEQPYRLVLIGEKSGLKDLLLPIAEEDGAVLCLPTGDISDIRIFELGEAALTDPRPLIVLYFADDDPSGGNMAVSFAERLLALVKLGELPDLQFRVYRAALTPEQVIEHDLPHIPVKITDPRKERWERVQGVGQTEIDAMYDEEPETIEEIVRDAIRPFVDETLNARVANVRTRWERQAQRAIVNHGGQELADKIAETAEWFQQMKAEADRRIAEINSLALGRNFHRSPRSPIPCSVASRSRSRCWTPTGASPSSFFGSSASAPTRRTSDDRLPSARKPRRPPPCRPATTARRRRGGEPVRLIAGQVAACPPVRPRIDPWRREVFRQVGRDRRDVARGGALAAGRAVNEVINHDAWAATDARDAREQQQWSAGAEHMCGWLEEADGRGRGQQIPPPVQTIASCAQAAPTPERPRA